MKRTIRNSLAIVFIIYMAIAGTVYAGTSAAEWPEATSQMKPWSRWWWMGSAVDKQNLSILLNEYNAASIGGMEICPIYGVKGYEDKFIDFLTPEWIEMLGHTLSEATDLGMGIDLTTGTGWPFGGPMVSKETASAGIILKEISYKDNKLSEDLPKGKLIYLTAISKDGQKVELIDKVNDGKLAWDAPDGQWAILAAAMKIPVQRVKRAAPGGEGYVVNPYSVDALKAYLEPFDEALSKLNSSPRCQFHDSFEYYGATWTPDFFAEFENRRGYDLRDNMEPLFGIGMEDSICRVMSDYHETINDLHLEYIKEWTEWCHTHGSKSRNQAHGAPANLIDLYGASDIPETEIFRKVEEEQMTMLKLSSSAAHLNGCNLVSSETFTWLKEHFQTAPSDLKSATDFMFLAGVNHIFFHGIPYSPQEAEWPGWQFYASVNFGSGGGLWKNLPTYNSYVTRCQSILQTRKSDNDILLYFPMYDYWYNKDKLHMTFTIHNQNEWLHPSVYARTAEELNKHGYSYDAVSDSYLKKALCVDGKIVINDTEYESIVIPYTRFMPEKTIEKLLSLAEDGASVLFQEKIPDDVPGLKDFRFRKTKRKILIDKIMPEKDSRESRLNRLHQANIKIPHGKGMIMVAELAWMLEQATITRESLAENGISFIRKRSENGFDYFLVNQDNSFDGWVTLGKPAIDAMLMDPLYENRIGKAAVRNINGRTDIYLQMKPHESLILRTFASDQHLGRKWSYTNTTVKPIELKGNWTVEFIDGGPALPAKQEISKLTSWTEFEDGEVDRFYGTARYTLKFEVPRLKADDWTLDLGKVCNSAKATVNGKYLGTLWSEPFQINVGPYLNDGTNTLEVEVTNLAANRVRDLDIKKVNWKYFYDINIVNIDYKPFDASGWPLFDSGLIGPVTIAPLKKIAQE